MEANSLLSVSTHKLNEPGNTAHNVCMAHNAAQETGLALVRIGKLKLRAGVTVVHGSNWGKTKKKVLNKILI